MPNDYESMDILTSSGIIRKAYGGWSEFEEEMLFSEATVCREKGLPLRAVFDSVAMRTGRKPNSVRNHYYARIKDEDMKGSGISSASFVPFKDDEVEGLIETFLTAGANGESIRACALRLAGGDDKLMLRYQNKYRAMLKRNPELVADIAARLEANGVAVRYRNTTKSLSREPEVTLGESAVYALRTAGENAELVMQAITALSKKAEEADRLRERLNIQNRDMAAQKERFMMLHSMFKRLSEVSRELVEAVRDGRINTEFAELVCGIDDCERIAALIV